MIFRESHAEFKKLSKDEQKEYEDRASANKARFRQEFANWRTAHGDKAQMRELLEAEEKVKELKLRMAEVRRAEKDLGKT